VPSPIRPTVPERATLPERTGVESAAPVRGALWLPLGGLANHLLGRGGALIPAYGLNKAVAPGGTATYRFTIWPRYQATHRVWLLAFRLTTGYGSMTFTDPSSGASSWTVAFSASQHLRIYEHIETISSRTSAETAIAPTLANAVTASASVTVAWIACYEIARPELAVDADDLGIDLSTLDSGTPVYDDAGKSAGGLAARLTDCRDVARRNSQYQFARNATDALEASTGSFVELLGHRPVFLEQFWYRSETTASVLVRLYVSADSATAGEIRLTMDSGATTTITVPSASAGEWRTGTLACDVEDLSAADGRRSTRWDRCTVEGRVTAGAGKVYLHSISIGRRAS
jgi:hypothetical protein